MTALTAFLALLLACGDKDTDDTGAGGTATDGGATTDGGTATDGGATADGGATVAEVHQIEPDGLATWFEDETELILINTHVPYEGEIPGTDVHIAYTDGAELIAAIGDDLDRLTVVYCKTGPMSATAAEALVEAGYTSVYDLTGGMNAWDDAGYELTE